MQVLMAVLLTVLLGTCLGQNFIDRECYYDRDCLWTQYCDKNVCKDYGSALACQRDQECIQYAPEYRCDQGLKRCKCSVSCSLRVCTDQRDCLESQACIGNYCRATGVSDSNTGSVFCKTAQDCLEGQLCTNGFCAGGTLGCTKDAECRGGQICALNQCVSSSAYTCVYNSECRFGETCARGRCSPVGDIYYETPAPTTVPIVCNCPSKWDPVCAFNGLTYGNTCSAQCAGITDVRPGECGTGTGNLNTYTGCKCGEYFLPVCAAGTPSSLGSTAPNFIGTTYPNPCQARCSGNPIFRDGPCNYQGCGRGGSWCGAKQLCVDGACVDRIPLGYYCKLSDSPDRCEPPTVCSDALSKLTPQFKDLGSCVEPAVAAKDTVQEPTAAPMTAAPTNPGDPVVERSPTSAPTTLLEGSIVRTCYPDLCGGQGVGGCMCDVGCASYGDCCPDYGKVCVTDSCQGRCGKLYELGEVCCCDDQCLREGDCCVDFLYVCITGNKQGSCRDRCGDRAGKAEETIKLDLSVNGCVCKTRWIDPCSNTTVHGCGVDPSCANHDGNSLAYWSPCQIDGECREGEFCQDGKCKPLGLAWCEIEDWRRCQYQLVAGRKSDVCVPDRKVYNVDRDMTVNGCRCKVSWSPRKRCPLYNGDVVSGCVMFPACNGDNGGIPGMSWCEIEDPSSCVHPPAGNNWDRCVPPRKPMLTQNQYPGGVGHTTIHGCECKASWKPTGQICPGVEMVKGCSMYPACDGNDGGNGWSWCIITDRSKCKIPLQLPMNFDFMCQARQNIRIEGPNVGIATYGEGIRSWSDCCAACARHSACQHWSYDRWRNDCHLKSSGVDQVTDSGFVSGRKTLDANGATQIHWDYCVPPTEPKADCYCDASCLFNDDCCVDFALKCPKLFEEGSSIETPAQVAEYLFTSNRLVDDVSRTSTGPQTQSQQGVPAYGSVPLSAVPSILAPLGPSIASPLVTASLWQLYGTQVFSG